MGQAGRCSKEEEDFALETQSVYFSDVEVFLSITKYGFL
jgi:hypothetical protein